VASSQYLGLAGAASVCAVTWLVASAITIASDVLFAGSSDVSRVPETFGLAFYSQVPWLLAVVVVAWHYQPPFLALEPAGIAAIDARRLMRLLRDDETRIVLRTVNECSTLWLHLLFGAGYHAISRLPLSLCLLLTSGIYGLPYGVGALL
jgi:hypothetical protein